MKNILLKLILLLIVAGLSWTGIAKSSPKPTTDLPNLKGAWVHRSYLLNPPADLKSRDPATAIWWAAGSMEVTKADKDFEAKLSFPVAPTPIVLDVQGTFEPGKNGGSPLLRATGRTKVGGMEVVYEINGWVLPDTPGSYERDATTKKVVVKNAAASPSIRGALRNVTIDLAGASAETVGTFLLVRPPTF